MSDEPKKRSRAWIGGASFALLGLLVLYPLSAGPLVWIANRTEEPPVGVVKAIDAFYEPLSWLRSKSETADNALDWYFKLWER
ncbi:MAG TPA: hypothetical protein VG055_23900 [Planctomycetaceae bacterium]|jgi:hypothetical protein|nr:hypothetical protein [Planctomycetaceae bacterium]